MKKLVFYGCIVLSACIGVVVGAQESWGAAIFCGIRFALGGLALGGLLTFLGGELMHRKRSKAMQEHDEDWERPLNPIRDGSGTSPEEIAENYWRDKGEPPFTNPEYLEDMRRAEELIRDVVGTKGLPPTMDRDDLDPGR